MRFESNEDYYLDAKTEIKWSKQNFGPMSWEDAMTKLPAGWRLPTIEELITIVDYTKHNPVTVLPDIILSPYWSSTAHAISRDFAWYINFHYGYNSNDYKSSSYYVRAVRYL